jgi:hypothetical protein
VQEYTHPTKILSQDFSDGNHVFFTRWI